MKKKVLIITYYWPPSGGPGVQRALKFAKYLPEYGWEPIILTIKNGEYPAIDESLAKDIPEGCKVFKTKAIEPNFFYRKFTGMKKDEKIPVANLAQKNTSWKKRISNWVRLNLFIPDAKIGWIPYAVKQGKKIIEQEKPDLIFSTSPPPSVHLIAKKLAKWSGIKWVADFRDPWTNIYHYDKANRSKLTSKIDKSKEQNVLSSATKVITVSESISKSLETKNAVQFNIIPNGFDDTEFQQERDTIKPEKFTICYSGKINMQQNPNNLWKVLASIIKADSCFAKDFQLLLIGNIENEVIKQIEQNNLHMHLKKVGYINHNELGTYFNQAQVMLLLIPDTKDNKGIITGKIFEYIASGKFVLGIGPQDGDAASILTKTSSGRMIDFDQENDMKKEILIQYHNWQNNIPQISNIAATKEYSRRNLTKKLANLFNQIEP